LDELTKRGDPGIDERETESAEGLEQGAVGDGLARESPGEQPRAAVIAPSAVGDEAVEQRRDGWRDGAWWVAEAQVALAVDVDDIVVGETQDAAERLGVEQQQTRGGAGVERSGAVVGVVMGLVVEVAASSSMRCCWVIAVPGWNVRFGRSRPGGTWPC
jgi:hypothetical protein